MIDRPICTGCNKHPDEISEYIECIEGEDMTPDEYVLKGTLNPENNHFLCTDCYIEAGMPTRPFPRRWVAP